MTLIILVASISLIFSQSDDLNKLRHLSGGIISGEIKDENGNSLIGANIFIKGTKFGEASNQKGRFRISNIPYGKYEISANYIGFKTETKNVNIEDGKELVLDFFLKQSLVDLDEVVVAASFSQRKKRAQASPVTIISESELRRLPVRSVDEVLLGKVPGGYANLPSRPGQNNSNFTLRGGTSGSGRPLGDVKIYVDGVELLGFDVQSYPGISDFLDPDDIEKIEVLRGPMGSTLHGSNAQSGIIHIFTKRGSRSKKTIMKMKTSIKSTEAPILDKGVAKGEELSFSMNGRGASDVGYNIGINRTVDEEVMPSNGRDVEQLKFHGGLNARIGSAQIDVKTFQSWGEQGFISQLYHLLEYKEQRGWVDAPEHWDDSVGDGSIAYYKPGLSLNYIHNFSPNFYQSLVVGNDTRQSLYKKYSSSGSGGYLKHDWNRTTVNYFLHFKKNYLNIELDITTGVQRTHSSNVRLSGNVDEKKDQYYYDDLDDASLVDQSYSNLGYYSELVLGYRDKLFFTVGQRLEENEYFGKDYGTHLSPRLGVSYVWGVGKLMLKQRAAWGSGGINPPKAMQALPSESNYSINIGNPDLRPERQSGIEVGSDFYFGDNFFLEATYFDQLFLDGIQNDRSIDDLFTPKEEYWYVNIGEIINRGWEFALKTRISAFDINATYSILDSRWGRDPLRQDDTLTYKGYYDEGVRRNDVPVSTANLSFSFRIPGFSPKYKKGGYLVLDANYIGEKKGRDWLLYYDGLYNPDVDMINYYSKDLTKYYEGYTTLRLRANYWITNFISGYVDIKNLTRHEDISSNITTPALGRQIIFGLDFEI